MSYSVKPTYFFEKSGPENTADAARIAVERARDLSIDTIVVASSSGSTARVFFDAIRGTGLRLVVVTHVVGFKKPGEWEFSADTAEFLQKNGAKIITGTHVLSGLERALSRSPKVGGGSRTEAIAEALRRTVATGLKVAVECSLIAADHGAIGVDREVIAAGGTASGADCVCVILPAHTASYFDLQVREIVAMPRNR
ncbi:MAG: hypothetical protein APR53_04510 [Methanoculleus sp. SDB]|nr:MAG: hypothetical protein APR53_04510 [Methanoculleus sp. SDB]